MPNNCKIPYFECTGNVTCTYANTAYTGKICGYQRISKYNSVTCANPKAVEAAINDLITQKMEKKHERIRKIS